MVDRFFAGSPEDMVTALIEYRGLTEEEATRITAMIDEAAEKAKETSPKKTKSKATRKRGR